MFTVSEKQCFINMIKLQKVNPSISPVFWSGVSSASTDL